MISIGENEIIDDIHNLIQIQPYSNFYKRMKIKWYLVNQNQTVKAKKIFAELSFLAWLLFNEYCCKPWSKINTISIFII